jgi:hypothetical protein
MLIEKMKLMIFEKMVHTFVLFGLNRKKKVLRTKNGTQYHFFKKRHPHTAVFLGLVHYCTNLYRTIGVEIYVEIFWFIFVQTCTARFA